MKKLVSILLALIMLFAVSSAGFCAYSASKTYAETKLAEIQKISGFVPGKTAIVTSNCYLFVAKVCEKLYGVTYNGEGLYDNYKAKHASGNYYTVSTYTTSHSTPTSDDIESIIKFFIKNATPGDIVHYGAYNSGYNKTHTFMISSISNKKISIYHSNYETKTDSKASCHVDDIYWDSFRANPTTTIYNSDNTVYSFNSLFYNTMKNGRGLGISINRYSKYENLYYLVGAATPTITVEHSSLSSVTVNWDEIIGASKYRIQYKKSGETSYKTASSSCTAIAYEIGSLELGAIYNFRVAAYIDGKWMDYSDTVSKTVLPPEVKAISFECESKGLKLTWDKRSDITGVKILRSTSASGTYKTIHTISNNSTVSYIDTGITYGKTYYYKIERYVKAGGEEYSSVSAAKSAIYKLSSPQLKYSVNSANSVSVSITASGIYDNFNYYVTDSSSKNFIPLTKTTHTSVTVNNMTPGESYNFYCRQATSLGSGEYTKLSVTAVPKKEKVISVSAGKNGNLITYSTSNDVDGYKLYRSLEKDKNYSYIATVANKNTDCYTDTKISINTTYYYKVRGYVKNGSSYVYSAYSSPSSPVKNVLEAPTVSVYRKSPTSFTVKWNAVENATKYTVEYKASGKSYSSISAAGTSKVISGLTLGTTYYIRVTAVNNFGSSEYSAEIKKQALPPTPTAPTLTNTKSGIKVSWKAAQTATGYKIYRSTSKNGTYSLIKTVNKKSTISFVDKNVKKNKGYYYKVAVYVSKDKKDYSSAKSAYSYIK